MSVFVYNGITLPYAQATSFKQEVAYEQSDTDWYCTKFDIQVQCYVNAKYLEYINSEIFDLSPNIDHNPADIMSAVRSKLMKPRKTLSYKFNDVELIPQKAGVSGPVDSQNGPRPQSCNILQLTNETFLLIYHIIANYWENTQLTANSATLTSANRPGNPILYNRWSEELVIDNCQYTTYKRTGKFQIRSDNVQGKTADEFRGLAVISIKNGFVREYAKYVIDPSGLGIQYEIVDKEIYKYPPFPAYQAEGYYKESTNEGGVFRFGEALVKLKGRPTINQDEQATLCFIAVSLCSSKLAIAGAPLVLNVNDKDSTRATIIGAFLKVSMYTNEVECGLTARFGHGKQRRNAVAAFRAFMCYTPLSQPVGQKPNYTLRGSEKAGMFLQAAAYYDPSILDTKINTATNNLDQGRIPGQAGKNPE